MPRFRRLSVGLQLDLETGEGRPTSRVHQRIDSSLSRPSELPTCLLYFHLCNLVFFLILFLIKKTIKKIKGGGVG